MIEAQIDFDGESHTYRVNGQRVPSVTQILQPYSGLEYVDKDVLRRAAAFGTNVHDACHLYDTGRLDEATLDPALVPYLNAWKQFLADTGAVVIFSEHRVASTRYGFAGTFDKLLYWGKTYRLVDIKSGSVVPKTVGPQLAAYAKAYAEEAGEVVKHRYCVHLNGDMYASHRCSDPGDWSIFLSALNLHKHFRGAA